MPPIFLRLRVKKRTPMMTIRWTIAIYPAVLRDFSTSTELIMTMLMEILHHCWIVTPRVYEPWTDNYFRVKTTRARLFCDKPGKLPNKVHLEVDPLVHPVVHPPRKIPSALLETAREKLTEMEEDRIIVKEEESTPWVSSMLVIDKRKWKKKNTPLEGWCWNFYWPKVPKQSS